MGDDRVALCRSLVRVPALSGIYVISDVTQTSCDTKVAPQVWHIPSRASNPARGRAECPVGAIIEPASCARAARYRAAMRFA